MNNTRVYTAVIIRNDQGKLLIMQRSNTSRFAPSQWEFVSGTIEPFETAEETAVREVFEETALRVRLEELAVAPVHELSDSDGRWVVIPFRAETSGDVHISEEHQAYRWMTDDEVLATPYVGDDYRALLEAERSVNLNMR